MSGPALNPLIINGTESGKRFSPAASPFYPDFALNVAEAGEIELSAAVGAARQGCQARRAPFEERADLLDRAANLFGYTQTDLETAVRLSGLPITTTARLFSDIPAWLRSVPRTLQNRFHLVDGELSLPFDSSHRLLFLPPPGFCYAVTPGNDLRASALAAANLVALGIPFILKSAARDPAAPLVIRALLQAGLDPAFASLVHFSTAAPHSLAKHHYLVSAASLLWTFGPDERVDAAMRFSSSGEDLFAGKIVLRHNSGNAAILLRWQEPPARADALSLIQESLTFPAGCMDARSILLLDAGEEAVESLAASLEALKVGDPLDPATQVGFVEPVVLDHLAHLLERLRLRLRAYGGERLSPYQARPLLVSSQEDLPDFFSYETPAPVLAARHCASVEEAITFLNAHTPREPRIAVSLSSLTRHEIKQAVSTLKAHLVREGVPTSRVVPSFHEGKDYALRLLQPHLVPA